MMCVLLPLKRIYLYKKMFSCCILNVYMLQNASFALLSTEETVCSLLGIEI